MVFTDLLNLGQHVSHNFICGSLKKDCLLEVLKSNVVGQWRAQKFTEEEEGGGKIREGLKLPQSYGNL